MESENCQVDMDTDASKVLSAVEVRVLGCLMEKEVTTPEYYPLTVNALLNACNQKSNRDPEMLLAATDVEEALESLRFTHRLVALVHTSGSRTQKYKHTVPDRYALGREALAVLCELFLRGPETMGELRARASRLYPFEGLSSVESALDDLKQYGTGPLVTKLPKEPGRRESRYMHLFAGTPDLPEPAAPQRESAASVTSPPQHEVLEQEVQALREELEQLKAEFAQFKRQFE